MTVEFDKTVGRLFDLANRAGNSRSERWIEQCRAFSTASLKKIGEQKLLERVEAEPDKTFLVSTITALLRYGMKESEIEGAIRLIYGSH